MFFIAYAFKGQEHVITSENCKSLVLQAKCNIEIFLSPENKWALIAHGSPGSWYQSKI